MRSTYEGSGELFASLKSYTHYFRLFYILISIPFLVHRVSTLLVRDCGSSGLEASKTTSSAYANAGMLILSQPIPSSDLLSASSRSFIYRLNSEGDSRQPCLTPFPTANQGVQWPFSSTALPLRVFRKGPLMPYRCSFSLGRIYKV